jgi:hypothetical protein
MSELTRYPEAAVAAQELNESAVDFNPLFFDPLIAAFKKDVDRTLLRENLKLTMQERSEKFLSFAKFIYEIRGKGSPGLKVWR